MEFETILSGLCLPNSVCIHDGKILISEGGTDSVLVFRESDFLQLQSLGGFGISKYNFREPVNATYLNGSSVAVCDWHNHRVVFYDPELTYACEIGAFTDDNAGNLVNVLKRMRYSYSSLGSYLFDSGVTIERHTSKIEKICNRIKWTLISLNYCFKRNRSSHYLKVPLNKPNGLCIVSDKLIVTVKNSQKIIILCMDGKSLISEVMNPEFGRLGQCCSFKEKAVLFCDETSQCLWHYSLNNQKLSRVALNMSRPFSVTTGNCRVFVAGGSELLVLDDSFKQLARVQLEGECHGICTHDDFLYLIDRENGLLNRVRLSDGKI